MTWLGYSSWQTTCVERSPVELRTGITAALGECMSRFTELSIDALVHVVGGLGQVGNAAAGAAMQFMAGEEPPKIQQTPQIMPQTTSQPGTAGPAPFQSFGIPGGGTATFPR